MRDSRNALPPCALPEDQDEQPDGEPELSDQASEPGRGYPPQSGVYREAGWNASHGAERGLDDRKEVHETRLIRRGLGPPDEYLVSADQVPGCETIPAPH